MSDLSQPVSALRLESALRRILPHRYPFLLVDRVTEFVPGVRIAGVKHFSVNDAASQGHFPQAPTVPGGILIEALTQLGAILVLSQPQMEGKVAMILNIPSARLLEPVHPGDTLRLDAEVVKLRAQFGEMRGVVSRDGQRVADGQMRFGIASAADLLPV